MTDELIFSFEKEKLENAPLAERVRPKNLDEIIGQNHLLGENSFLAKMINEDKYSSFLLWGPPGTGKTTVAKIIENKTNLDFYAFSAVFSGIKEVKELMKNAEYNFKISNKPIIIFIDEIHRFNKSQQDAFLPYVENGSIILVGATTENPSFEIISALLSRCHVFCLEHLSLENLKKIIIRAVNELGKSNLLDSSQIDFLVGISAGDARKALNNLDVIINYFSVGSKITIEHMERVLQKKALFYDKNGEEHYNLISALHKSVRGSDPQAAIYWLARMLESGEDPMYIVRRLIRMATEDIGLADPMALNQAVAVKEAVMMLGMPEANTALTQLVVYLAISPKSNSTELAYNAAKKDVYKTGHLGVPLHIRNAPTKLMKDLNYGNDYKYDHDYENHYFYQKYFPDNMEEKTYYDPSEFGFEKEIEKRLKWWNSLKNKQKNKKNQ